MIKLFQRRYISFELVPEVFFKIYPHGMLLEIKYKTDILNIITKDFKTNNNVNTGHTRDQHNNCNVTLQQACQLNK